MANIDGLSCTLKGAELVQRIGEWQRISQRAIRRVVTDGSVVATYPNEKEILQELQRLIAAEADCCPFMEFELAEAKDRITVELQVPPDMRHVLPLLLGLVSAESENVAV